MIRVATGAKSIEQVEFTFSDGSVLIFGAPGEFAMGDATNLKPKAMTNPFGLKEKTDTQKEELLAIPGEPFFIGDDAYLVGIITHEKEGTAGLRGIAFHTTAGR